MNFDFRKRCLGSFERAENEGRCLIIGEVAQSHDGSLGMAHSYIDAIANAGADAVKFQTHIAAEESTPAEPWRVKFSLQDETRYQYWQRMQFSKEQWQGLKNHCDERGILFISTPFSELAAEWLAAIGMRVWKAASGEIGNLPLLRKMAAQNDPVIISSGMSDYTELDRAVEVIKESKNPLAILQCTTAYPCPPEQIGLNVMDVFQRRYGVAVGLSDHSGKIYAGLAAAALGAEVLEVHVALSREMFGPDVPASVTTAELKLQVEGIRQIEAMLNHPVDKDQAAAGTANLREMFNKSIVAGTDLAAGTMLEPEHLKLKKPGFGLAAAKLPALIGKTTVRDLKIDELILMSDLK